MNIKVFILILLASFVIPSVYSQKSNKKVLSGLVTDENNRPVSGAMIFVDNINTKKVTDTKGKYKVKVDPEASVLSTYTSFSGMTDVQIKGKTTVNFTLPGSAKRNSIREDIEGKSGKTFSKESGNNQSSKFNKISGDEYNNARYLNIYEMLRGTVPGVVVNGKQITIRGQSSFFGSTQPLFVVDGTIVSSIDDVLPSQVKSIEVIKSSSAAIYGSRGSNGVIVIKRITASDIR